MKINRKKLAIRIVSLILFIFILMLLTLKFHWFYSIWWFDMPMHILGGFWLGLIFIWLLKPKEFSFSFILKITLGFLFVAFLWEMFELSVDKIITQKPFNMQDTLSDTFFGLAGVFCSMFYFLKNIMTKERFNI